MPQYTQVGLQGVTYCNISSEDRRRRIAVRRIALRSGYASLLYFKKATVGITAVSITFDLITIEMLLYALSTADHLSLLTAFRESELSVT